ARLPNLASKIRVGNSLISGSDDELKQYFGDQWNDKKPFNYEQQFSEVFERKNPGFDVIIGNPPYVQLSLESIDANYKRYLLDKYKSSMGRLNTFGFFIKAGIDLLREKGMLGYIVPNTLLTQDYYSELRKIILSSCRIDSIVTFSGLPFDDAVVENTIIVLQKISDEKIRNENQIDIFSSNQHLTFDKIHTIQQKRFFSTYKNAFNIFINENLSFLKQKIQKNCNPLSYFLLVNQGIALKHDRARYIFKEKLDDLFKPVLDGRHIERYSLRWDGSYLRYDTKAIHSCKRTDIFTTQEKIFFRRVGERLTATLDTDKFYALNTLVVMNKKENLEYDIRFLLALFNSSLLNFYYKTFLKSTKTVFSEIQARQVEQLPIKSLDLSKPQEKRLYDEIVSLADKMMMLNNELHQTTENTDKWYEVKRQIEHTDYLIDEKVFEVYGIDEEQRQLIMLK
ncbi:MAG: Eco57I restriction-modification methylase domain-containing protein, partial [Thermodesulfovibrionales bacterium]|nr:Eco57I restriction-modification methylase domain-containing protein [Thermodesulfovibrionales bacterium]